MSQLVLLVEPNVESATALRRELEAIGLRVIHVATAREAAAALQSGGAADLAIVELELPDRSGLDLCRGIRGSERTRSLPIVMVSERGEEIDRVVGLEIGGDDYVTKPYSVRELALRVRALLRRAAKASPAAESGDRLRLDPATQRVWIDDTEIRLTALQFRILWALWTHRGRVLSREHLVAVAWAKRPPRSARAIDTHVQRLRDRLEPIAHVVETVRGTGYRMHDPADPKP